MPHISKAAFGHAESKTTAGTWVDDERLRVALLAVVVAAAATIAAVTLYRPRLR